MEKMMNGARTNTERQRSLDKDREDGGCKYHSSKKSNQTMVVKHCQAFQISVAHQRDLEAHNHQHTPSRTKLIKK